MGMDSFIQTLDWDYGWRSTYEVVVGHEPTFFISKSAHYHDPILQALFGNVQSFKRTQMGVSVPHP